MSPSSRPAGCWPTASPAPSSTGSGTAARSRCGSPGGEERSYTVADDAEQARLAPPAARRGAARGRVHPDRRRARGAVPRHHQGGRSVIAVNPVLGREVKERFRGVRGWVMLTAYLVLLAGVLFVGYQAAAGANDDPFAGVDATQIAQAGRSIFEVLVIFMLLLVLFLVPAMTSGAIAGERERQTLVPLQVTLVRPLSIIVGQARRLARLRRPAGRGIAARSWPSPTWSAGSPSATCSSAWPWCCSPGSSSRASAPRRSAVFRRVQAATVISYARRARPLGRDIRWLLDAGCSSTRRAGPTPMSVAPAEFLIAQSVRPDRRRGDDRGQRRVGTAQRARSAHPGEQGPRRRCRRSSPAGMRASPSSTVGGGCRCRSMAASTCGSAAIRPRPTRSRSASTVSATRSSRATCRRRCRSGSSRWSP